MTRPDDTSAVVLPLICFGSAVGLGLLAFGYAKLTNNGIFLIGFLLFFVPFSVVALILGAIFSIKAYGALPARHWGRYALAAAIALVVVLLIICTMIIVEVGSHPAGGF
jgi:hypothetical protein